MISSNLNPKQVDHLVSFANLSSLVNFLHPVDFLLSFGVSASSVINFRHQLSDLQDVVYKSVWNKHNNKTAKILIQQNFIYFSLLRKLVSSNVFHLPSTSELHNLLQLLSTNIQAYALRFARQVVSELWHLKLKSLICAKCERFLGESRFPTTAALLLAAAFLWHLLSHTILMNHTHSPMTSIYGNDFEIIVWN